MILNFVIMTGELKPTDQEIFDTMIIDPDLEEVVKTECSDLESLSVIAGVFPSKGRARKNGFSGPIPHGLSFFGTKKKRFWVWNPNPPESNPVISKSFDHTDRWFNSRTKQ